MPIKLPKGFNRRKSSGTPLEEVPNPPEPSFRVLERPRTDRRSLDGALVLKRVDLVRPVSGGRFADSSSFDDERSSGKLRGSAGTQTSSSSAGHYAISSSSPHFGSSSTLPSSASIHATYDDTAHAHPKPPYNVPIPPIPPSSSSPGFSLRNAGRSFSFGRKSAHAARAAQTAQMAANEELPASAALPLDLPDLAQSMRERAMTETSGSTATPSKFLDLDLNLTLDGVDGSGRMFEMSDAKENRPSVPGANMAQGTASHSHPSWLPYTPPPPLSLHDSRQASPSPYTNESTHSNERLMTASPDRDLGDRLARKGQNYLKRRSMTMTNGISAASSSPLLTGQGQESGLRRASVHSNSRPDSTHLQDADALLVLESLKASRRMNRESYSYEDPNRRAGKQAPDKSDRSAAGHYSEQARNVRKVSPENKALDPRNQYYTPLQGHGSLQSVSTNATARGQRDSTSKPPNLTSDDLAFQELARSALQYSTLSTTSLPTNRVMTPAQFERYRNEKETTRARSDSGSSAASDDGSEGYDEEDEAERNKLLAKQRKKQEAHLSVYRQQMMKVTGEISSDAPQRPGLRYSQTAPTLGTRSSMGNLRTDQAPGASDDEDEDIPLGILAAHGFPAKDKPPTHLSQIGSAPNIRYTSESYPPPPASVSGRSAAGGPRSNLPAFARNLPKDPYFGASIVNPSNRESLAFGAGNRSSFAVGPGRMSVPPGGLVGVIAEEEAARARRRGAGSNQYGQVSTPLMNGANQMTPSSSAPVSEQQAMTQMMQMMQAQAQWMQQMQQTMAMQQAMQNGQMPFAPPMMIPLQGPPQTMPPMPPNMMPPGMMPPTMLAPPQQPIMPTPLGNPRFLASPGAASIQAQRPLSTMQQSMPRASQPARPTSVMPGAEGGMASWTQAGSRTSMMPNPRLGMRSSNDINSYAPSIAPSERSNVGLPSRYRPVSVAATDEIPRTASRSSSIGGLVMPSAWVPPATGPTQPSSSLRLVTQPAKVPAAESDDDADEEEAWEAMKRKKERKRSLWRGRKKSTHDDLSDVYFGNTTVDA